jgi:recombination protein RecR
LGTIIRRKNPSELSGGFLFVKYFFLYYLSYLSKILHFHIFFLQYLYLLSCILNILMPEALKRLIHSISLLPWIGEKTATRIAFFLLSTNKNFIEDFRVNLSNIKEKIGYCQNCHAITDSSRETCSTCENISRDTTKICVVEEYLDMLTVEQSGWYDGVYHILWWAISPINGVFVADLNFASLFLRIEQADMKKVEIILATNPNIEWEATSMYIKEQIEKRWLKHRVVLTRLSRWLSSWYIEYADNITLLNAMKERKEIL